MLSKGLQVADMAYFTLLTKYLSGQTE